MPPTAIRRLTLTNFRSYAGASLRLDGGRPVLLSGPNGAGKTNLLEAVSYLAPGRGLRGAAAPAIARRAEGVDGWSVAAEVQTPDGAVAVGTGAARDAVRRVVRLDGATVAPGRLLGVLRLVWLTPEHDRLFVQAASERRRFLDRLVFAAEPAHAAAVTELERALRERLRLLTDGPDDGAWLCALEARAAEAGASVAAARLRAVDALQEEIEARAARPFPLADLALSGDWNAGADLGPRLAEALRRARGRDAAAGRSLVGPQRADLVVTYRQKRAAAAEASTGEQKALLINLVLAQAARLVRGAEKDAESAPSPILLLDEAAAHLDVSRRAALFDEVESLGLQAFLTGADPALFAGQADRAERVHVDQGVLHRVEGS